MSSPAFANMTERASMRVTSSADERGESCRPEGAAATLMVCPDSWSLTPSGSGAVAMGDRSIRRAFMRGTPIAPSPAHT